MASALESYSVVSERWATGLQTLAAELHKVAKTMDVTHDVNNFVGNMYVLTSSTYLSSH
jgi:hypothetical protein